MPWSRWIALVLLSTCLLMAYASRGSRWDAPLAPFYMQRKPVWPSFVLSPKILSILGHCAVARHSALALNRESKYREIESPAVLNGINKLWAGGLNAGG